MWLNDGIYYQWKTTCFGLSCPSSGFDNFLVIRVKYIIYISLIARKLSKSDDGRHRPKNVVFH